MPNLKNLDKQFINYTIFAVVFLMTLVLINALVGQLQFPTYGVWTGNVPLEHKLKNLREFSKEGPVDAVIMGSSSADSGFSTENFSMALSRSLGRPVRVFNMATGAGDWQMFPIMYRLTRLYADPKQLYIFHGGSNGTGDNHVQVNTLWPDGQFMYSNAGKFLRFPLLFQASESLWMSPIINAGGAARDLALYGRMKHIPSSSLLNYPANKYGDKISHLFMHDVSEFNVYREYRKNMILSAATAYTDIATPHNCETNNPFFSRDDLKAIHELRALLASDKVELILVHQEPSAGYSINSLAYKNALDIFYNSAIKKCLQPEKTIYPIDFLPFRYEIEDTQHLNVHGARRFALEVAARLGYTNPPSFKPAGFYALDTYPSGLEFHHLMAVILSDASARKTIDITYYTLNSAPVDLAALRSYHALQIELLSPDGTVHIGKAFASDGKTISFSFPKSLPAEPIAFLSRLVEIYPDGVKHYMVVPAQKYVWKN